MKKLVYVFFGIALLYIVLALFGPSEIKVEREIVIQQPVEFVKAKLGDFKFFHDAWSPWTKKDSSMVCTYKGNPGEIGHFYSWSGNKLVGAGEMELISIGTDSICARISFAGRGDSKVYFIAKSEGNDTKVTWGMLMKIGFFGRTPMLFMSMDKRIGSDFEAGLSELKKVLETIDPIAEMKFDIKELYWEEVSYLGRKETVSFDQMDRYFETNFGMLSMVIEKEKITPASPPSGLYFSYDEVNQKTELSCAYKVPKGTVVKGWETYTFPATKVVSVEFHGDPSNSGVAHNAIANYLKEKVLDYNMVIEEYSISPEKGGDPSTSVTTIYYLLK